MEEENESSIHRNNQDIAQKAIQEEFSAGTKPLIGLGLDTPAISQSLPTGRVAVETKTNNIDYLYELEDGSWLHIEYQSTNEKWDIYRFLTYYVQLMQRYHKVKGVPVEDNLLSVVIYTQRADVKEEKQTLRSKQNKLYFETKVVHVPQKDGESKYVEIKEKINTRPSERLTQDERQYLMYNPFMEKSDPSESVQDRALEIIDLLKHLTDENDKFQLIGTMSVLTYNLLSDDAKKEIWRVFEMTKVFEKEMRERDRERDKESKDQLLLDQLSGHLGRNKSDDYIKEALLITDEKLRELKRKLNS
ncbi:hypothetical protein HUG15_01770 [Salicibibacter cibarius]|uniref:Rpn family recombination-promoting nuclease/putative transposase n=1 Tax=Salicibibacter cibarius TaxID=2743000 RepID=A0A7T7CA27_9BACI|nr:hypothetical protein [Salicibibacter cibarius]QQK74459.1 hypothetical protein HUG15_01770 [Salicibibacter cibarius]